MAALLSIEQAQAAVLAACGRLPGERIAVEDALDRVLAEDQHASAAVPPFRCSAMDGYALTPGPAGRSFPIAGESRAGHPFPGRPAAGSAIRVSTGAAVPDGLEAVVRQEDVALQDGCILTRVELAPGSNVRQPGEDMRAGARVLAAGTVLGVGELGAAVAAGAGELSVARRPRVRVLCTGDELRAPGEKLGPGEIHNSNAPMLVAGAVRCGADVTRAQRLADDRRATTAAIAAALEDADVVVVCGGVSVGDHDHVKPALAELGVSERFWGVALQPGKPTWFGTLGERLVFGLPGNPVSAIVTFSLFAAPALLALQGGPPPAPPAPEAALAAPVARNQLREQALRARLEWTEHGLRAHPHARQDSHLVTSLLGADALALIAAGEGTLPAGTRVPLRRLVR
jgi:molybdopterin molybdotransferase